MVANRPQKSWLLPNNWFFTL